MKLVELSKASINWENCGVLPLFKATTILAVKKDNKVAIAGDGQVTFSESIIMKHQTESKKAVQDKVLAGYRVSC